MRFFNSSRRPAILYGLVMWIISFVMAGFLIQLGAAIIADVPLSQDPIRLEQFIDQDKNSQLEQKSRELATAFKDQNRRIEDLTADQNRAIADYNSARVTFENWLKTRSATENQAQNPEVVDRTRALDTLNDRQRAAQRAVEDASAELAQISRQSTENAAELRQLRTDARAPYEAALRTGKLNVFLIRLAITLPLLAISAWLILRKRQSSYWPLYRGFVFFSLFAFFVELVPYLPSYGGYLRSIVGVLLVAIAGFYIIRAMRRYLENKRLEEQKSESERRKTITYETALKKLNSNLCPSCDRSIAAIKDAETDFCVHCGFCLYQKCQSCGTRDNSFHKFCGACGVTRDADTEPEPALNP